ncbi:MAG: flippase [candidate division WOR-3 bacterium]|nr:flippase [candidate division WOR-3 bacterium]MDH7518189.1 flippase [bacterium]
MDLSTEQSFDHPVSASRRIIKNTFFLAIADVVNKAMMFVFYLVAARHLSVEQFGVLSFATTFVTMWSVFSDLGLGVVSARELARDRIEGRRQVNIALAIKLVATLLVIGLIVLVVNLMKLNSEKVRVVYIATIFVLQTAFTTYFASVFQGVEKMHLTTVSRILQAVVLVAGVFVLRTGPARVESYTWLYVLAGLISVLFAAGAAYVLVRPSFDFHIKRWWGVLKEAFPIGLAIILVSFYYWNGTTFLTKMSGDEAVGAYSAAFRVVWGTLFITLSFSASIYPFFSRLYVSEPTRLSEILKQALRYITVLTLPVGGFGTLLAKPIVFLLYGTKYSGAVTPFMILVWWSVGASFSSILSNYFIAINRASEMTIQSGLSLGVNLLGNVFLIPRFGAIGAAASITAAEFAGVLYLWLRHLRTPYRVTVGDYMSILGRGTAALILAILVAWLLGRYNIGAAVFTGVVLYAFFLMVTRVISRQDIKFVQRLIGKRVVKES